MWGLSLTFPTAGNPRLQGRPHEQLDHIELSPLGLHWPDPDEDLTIEGILAGDFGQEAEVTSGDEAREPRRLGEAAGRVHISDDFDEPMPDFEEQSVDEAGGG